MKTATKRKKHSRIVLKEVFKTAADNAAVALSQMLSSRIYMKVQKIKLLPVQTVQKAIGSPETLAYGIYFRVLGDIQGGLLISFPRDTAMDLMNLLLHRKGESSFTLSAQYNSALQEAGNVIAGSFITSIGKTIKKNLLLGMPHVTFDMTGAMIDLILIETAQFVDQALILEIEFHNYSRSFKGQFFILPDSGAMHNILKETGNQHGR